MTEHYLDRLAKTINENWDQPALSDFYLLEEGTTQDPWRGYSYTYGEMYKEILFVCNIFQTLGLQKGDHVAICGTNSSHWAIAYLAIAAYQGVAVTILHSQSPEDIAHQIDFSDAKALFLDSELWEELKSISLPQIEHVINLENWQILRGKQIRIINHQSSIINQQCQFVHGSPDNLAMICFTSGSTEVSKGVMLSYRNLSVNIDYILRVFSAYKGTEWIQYLPLSHIFGLTSEFLHPLCLGTHINVLRSVISRKQIVKCYHIINPSYLICIPLLIDYVISNSTEKNLTYFWGNNVREIFIGGAGLPEELMRKILNSGVSIGKGYGMTECAPSISWLTQCGDILKYSSVGVTLPSVSISISPNGEILVKGENVMLGYYKEPEATARKIDKDGWLHTGDKGHLDEDGYLYVEGRLEQDMIVLPNGENIHPEDIEHKINALPEVKESIVIAREGKLVAIVVAEITNHQSPMTSTDLRRMILRNVNPQLPLYSQLYDIEITDAPLQKTEKQTLKRYLYK